ncbi:hypothetical protein N0G65_000595 [Providencia rettgeri]|nr:hypothetical protein [Providencia rettgeri]
MSKRITITLKNHHDLNIIDEFCENNNLSRSMVVSNILSSATPLLSNINNHTKIVDTLKKSIFSQNEVLSQDIINTESKISIQEYLSDIWKTHLVLKIIIDEYRYTHSRKKDVTNSIENKDANDNLKHYIASLGAKKAILIYLERKIHSTKLSIGGYTSTILIKNIEFKNYYFDFNAIVSLPINDIINLGVRDAVAKKMKNTKYNYDYFVPITHSNEHSILVPVLDTNRNAPKNKHSPNTIIINPF